VSDKLTIAPDEYWYGEKTLLTWPLAALLNSRQARYPRGSEPWIQTTLEASATLAREDKVLLTSTGMQTWEFAAFATGEVLGQQIVLTPLSDTLSVPQAHQRLHERMVDLGLIHQHTLFIPWLLPRGTSEKKSWPPRDSWIADRARELFPISIRPRGSLERLLAREGMTAQVDDHFRIPYRPHRPAPIRKLNPDQVRETIDPAKWEYLVHWTRRTSAPWPGESRADYFRAVLQAGERDSHDALSTLLMILKVGRIRGTRWRMPHDQPMVSFTSLAPHEMIARMSWRKRYVRPAFEPYGIAVKRETLQQFGGRAVRYGDTSERAALSPLDRLFFQVAESSDHLWRGEQEWRLRGDLPLPEKSSDQVLILVPTQSEAELVRSICPFEVLSLSSQTK